MAKDRQIRQPNRVTTARYDYSVSQKNIMIHLISCLQGKMSMHNQTLFKEEIVQIPLKMLDGNNNYDRILKESKSMINKPISYVIEKEGGKSTDVLTTLISTVLHEHGSSYITYVIPSYALPILCYLGDGFTRFREAIALNLKSSYTKRIYELCCRWEDKEGHRMSIKEFKDQLGIPETYTSGNLKQRVLEVAKKELKKDGDLYFEYSIEKNGRKWENLRFKIISKNHSTNPEQEKLIMGEYYQYVYKIMESLFITKGLLIAERLDRIDDGLKMAYNRFKQLEDEYSTGKKSKQDLVKICATILKKDYKIELNTLK